MFSLELRKGKRISQNDWSKWMLISSGIIVICGVIQGACAEEKTRDIPSTVRPLKRHKPPTLPCGAKQSMKPGDEFFIESPDFRRQRYPNSVKCDWKFKSNQCSMGITCPDFDLTEFLCFDFVDIVDQNGKATRYCGRKGPKETSLSENVTISFTSSALFTAPGFRCRVVCRENEPGMDESVPFPKPEAPPVKCACGESILKVVGGEPQSISSYPWQAGLVRKGGSRPFCSGSLINSRYVLTAAHCVQGRTPYNLELVFNVTNVGSQGDELREVRRTVENILVHKKYTSRLDYDAALIHLSEPVDIRSDLLPVCLPTPEDLQKTYEGQNATITGWGLTSEDGDLSDQLLAAEVKVISNKDCAEYYPSVTERMLCAHTPGKDACQGDSGGPLVYAEGIIRDLGSFIGSSTREKYVLIGIVSWGDGCGVKPGVYTRVTELLNWIAVHAKDGSYCATA